MQITSKAEFYRLWEAGVLGNRPHLFRDPYDAYASGFPLIGFRQIGVGGGKWERVPHMDVLETARRWKNEGRKFIMDSGIYPATDHDITLQGEICRTIHGLSGTLGFCAGYTMRAAMSAGLLIPRSPSEVITLLRDYMDSSSQDDVWNLLELYPDAVIEFSCFRKDVGIFPHRNTFIWEVRCY